MARTKKKTDHRYGLGCTCRHCDTLLAMITPAQYPYVWASVDGSILIWLGSGMLHVRQQYRPNQPWLTAQVPARRAYLLAYAGMDLKSQSGVVVQNSELFMAFHACALAARRAHPTRPKKLPERSPQRGTKNPLRDM